MQNYSNSRALAMELLQSCINSLAPGKFEWNFRHEIFTDFSDCWLRHLLWNCPNMNVAGLHWWSVNIGSGQAPSHYLSQCWPRSLLPSLGHTELSHWYNIVYCNTVSHNTQWGQMWDIDHTMCSQSTHSIPCPHGWAMGFILWAFWLKMSVL